MNNKNIKKNVPLKTAKTHVGTHQTKKVPVKSTISKQTIYILLGIALLTIIAFSSSLSGEFLNWDDKDFIVENAYVKDFTANGIKNIFMAIDKHDPITAFTHAVTYNIWGATSAVPYHVLNLLFHIINMVLVYFLILKISKRWEAAAITALLFAIHPLRVESVAWIAERKDVLYTLFYLSSLIVYINYITKDYKTKFFVYAIILFICSLLSKFAAVTLPVTLLLIDYFYDRKFTTKVILEKVPFFALALLRGMAHYLSAPTISGNELITQAFPFYDRIFMGSHALMFYLTRVFYFFDLAVLNPYPVKTGNLLPIQYYIEFIFTVIFVIFVIWVIMKKPKHLKDYVFAIFFFLINVGLVLHLVPFGGGIVVGDRYSYLPYVGIFFLFGQLYVWLTDKSYIHAAKAKTYVYTFLIIYVLACMIITVNRNEVWKNSLNLWTDAVKHYPEHFYGYYGVGNAKADMGGVLKADGKPNEANQMYKEAIDEYLKAIKLNPKFPESYYNMGSVKYNNLKDYQGAIPDFNKAIELNPNHITAYTNRGLTKQALKDYQGAMADFDKAIQMSPYFAVAYNFRGNLNSDIAIALKEMKNFDEAKAKVDAAINDYNKAIQLNPNYAEAFNGRGIVYGQIIGDNNKALGDFNRALELNPQNAEGYMNRGSCKFFMNDKNGACADWQKSVQLGNAVANQLINMNCK